jgi:hypothetical protein
MKRVTLETVRTALLALKTAGVRVHHVELGYLAYLHLKREMLEKCELRDDVGYGSHPATLDAPAVKAAVLEGVVLAPDMLLPMGDQWAIVFGVDGDAATDYALTPEHRALYAHSNIKEPCGNLGGQCRLQRGHLEACTE